MTWMVIALFPMLAAATADQPAAFPTATASHAPADFAAAADLHFTFDPAASITLPSIDATARSASATLAPSAHAQPPATSTDASLAADQAAATAPAIANRFFKKGSRRWQITGAFATQFDDHFGLLGVGVSYFIEDDFTIDFELNGLYFIQDQGDDTPGVNLAMQLRWHFLHDKTHADNPHWSLYADAGFGVLLTAHEVPAHGKQFHFTPQVGAGISWLLDESSDTRLLTGVRWHHTSNANTHENNPGANKIMLYAGVNFPF